MPEFFKLTDTPQSRQTLIGHLAFSNLQRGQSLGLPSGQTVARLLGEIPLTDEILWSAGSRLLDRKALPGDTANDLEAVEQSRARIRENWVEGHRGILKSNAPIWYYVLLEAEYYGVSRVPHDPAIGFCGQHVGPVGSRIVCETLIGLLWRDETSFLHSHRPFVPSAEIANGGRFDRASLIRYALS